jgi:hypothetical protein
MPSASGIIENQAVAKRLCQPAHRRPVAMRLALYEPDIPQNTGTILRLSACLGVAVDIVEPCGFVSTIGVSAAPAWTISTPSISPATAPGTPTGSGAPAATGPGA